MNWRYPLLLALILSGACRPRSSDADRTLEGTPADSLVTGTGDHLPADTNGVEFEAHRLIPGMLAMLAVIEEREGRLDEGTAAGYRQAAARLVNAMLTDLNRVGVGDDGRFRALGDSILVLIGGGPGEAPEVEPEAVLRSAAMTRRLIARYQQQMRAVQE